MPDERMIEAVGDTIGAVVTRKHGAVLDPETQRYVAGFAIAEHDRQLAERGLVIVPREATEAMVRAGDEWTHCGGSCGNRAGRYAWRAMLDAYTSQSEAEREEAD